MLTPEVGPGRKSLPSLGSACVDSNLRRWETPDDDVDDDQTSRKESESGAIRVASPLRSKEGKSIMATDFESFGARGACVRMIIYWECAADPYIYSHSPFIPAEGGGCNTVDFSQVVGNSWILYPQSLKRISIHMEKEQF